MGLTCIYALSYARFMSLKVMQARALQAAQLFKERGVKQSDIALALGVSQSQVSRVLAGHVSRHTKLFEEICRYADSFGGGVSLELVRQNDELLRALAETWDGSVAHSRALAAVIRSLGVLNAGNSIR